MAFKKTLAHRLFNFCRNSNHSLTNCRITLPAATTLAPPDPDTTAPDPGDDGITRRFLHRRPVYYSSDARAAPWIRPLPTGEGLMERLREMDAFKERIRLDGLIPPPAAEEEEEGAVTVEDARKLLRLSQMETVKEKLRRVEKAWISYGEFVEICGQGWWSEDHAKEVAQLLDQSGHVIVLGNIVFLRPEQVVKAIQGLIPVPTAHSYNPTLRELETMEEHKAAIDKDAEKMVRRELWLGLGYFVIQTAALMRLTFWELSWDVMEPICFYVTSIYCMAGYSFFLRTSKEPSFEGFFQSRFSAKQKRLMKLQNFDVERYNELRRTCYPNSPPSPHNALMFDPMRISGVKKTV